ncbi:DUF6380 family protein [Streptomyces sp. NPDC052682]
MGRPVAGHHSRAVGAKRQATLRRRAASLTTTAGRARGTRHGGRAGEGAR